MPGIFSRPGGRSDTNYYIDQNSFDDEEFRGEYTGTNLIYKGFARPGGNVDEPVWQISFLTYDGSNNVLTVQWPLRPAFDSSVPESETVGTLTTPWITFNGTLTTLPIIKGSVVITAGAITFTDELMNGTLTGDPIANTGTIDYDTGDIVLTFNPALLMDTAVNAVYSTYALGGASNDYEFVWSERHSYTYV